MADRWDEAPYMLSTPMWLQAAKTCLGRTITETDRTQQP